MPERIIKKNIADLCEEWTKVCGANRNLYRITPSVIDGLKPGLRRALYAMFTELPKDSDKARKYSRIVGDSMRFYPHGDAAMGDAIAKSSQWFNNNVLLFKTEGNEGTVKGDTHAALRYIEGSITPYAWDCFYSDFKKCSVEMKEAYTGEEDEPEYFPAKYPHALFNGSLGIGTGLSCNIPPHNFNEVIDATLTLMDNPEANILLYPDSPTGCDIIDDGQFFDVSNNVALPEEKAKYTMRATYRIDYENNVITFDSIPFQLPGGTDSISLKVASNKDKFPEIRDIKDGTTEDTIALSFILKKDANPDVVVKKLFKATNLQKSYHINIVLIDDYQDIDYSLKSFLLDWIEYRRDAKIGYHLNNITKIEESLHIYKILLFMVSGSNAKKTLDITSKTKRKNLKQAFMDAYGITSLQAEKIAGMDMGAFAADSKEEYEKKVKTLEEELIKENKYIDDLSLIDEEIKNELLEGKKKYGRPRQSKIIKPEKMKKVKNKEVIVAISSDGFAKKLDADVKNIGKVGNNNCDIAVIPINNRDDLLIFDKDGKVSRIPVSSIPDTKPENEGISLVRYFTVENEILTIIKDVTNSDDASNYYVVFVTKNGISKKTLLSDFKSIKDFKTAIKLNSGDELVSVKIINEKDTDMIVYTNLGHGIRINPFDSIKTYSKNSKGLSLISLEKDEHVVNTDILNKHKKLLAYLTSIGNVKLTEIEYLPSVERKSKSIRLINLNKDEQLAGIISVNHNDILRVYKKYGEPQDVDLSTLDISSRASKGTKVITLRRGDNIVSYKCIE